jgi:glycerol-3-phosphate acyltransferase PlsY
MAHIPLLVFGIVFSYLVGCVCTGYYLTKLLSGKNLGRIGSKSLGATNVGRVLGKKGFVITFLLDLLKGIFVAYVANYIGLDKMWILLFGIMAVVGHIWPFQLNFSGGKGVSTFLGVMLFFDYRVVLSFMGIFLPLYLLTRKFSMAGLIVISFSPIILYLFNYDYGILLISVVFIGIIMIAHKTNIKGFFTPNISR